MGTAPRHRWAFLLFIFAIEPLIRCVHESLNDRWNASRSEWYRLVPILHIHPIFNKHESNESTRISQRLAMISDVPPRHDGRMEILFLLFSETVLFRARGVASRDIQRAYSQQLLAKGDLACFAKKIDQRMLPEISLARANAPCFVIDL